MKIARVMHNGRTQLALVEEEAAQVILLWAGVAFRQNPIQAVIERRLTKAELLASETLSVPISEVTFLSPFSALVRNVFAVGKNYADHALEFDKSGFNATSGVTSIPVAPQIFTKASTALAGPTDDIFFDPEHATQVDYEGEIGVVIGAECRNVDADSALDKVFGFVILNDVTARDLQKKHAQWFLGKSLDTFCPLGPWITTFDDAPIESLKIRTWVNDELRQEAPLTELIFDIPTLIATLSRTLTLLPGDIIATGTPVGVGIGFSPPRFLRNGDVVRVSADGLGELRNRVRTTEAFV